MKGKIKYIIYGGSLCILLIGVIAINFLYQPHEDINSDIAIIDEVSTSTEVDDSTSFYVDIKGAVKHPGVYQVNDKMIVNDLIKLSGGLNKNAYTNNINLATKLKEGMVVYIYNKNEVTSTTNITSSIVNDAYYEVNNNSSNNGTNNSQTTTSSKININTATKEQLMSISGLGESKALAIIEYRNSNKFNTIEDIKNVSGIGESLFVKIKEYITV